MCWSWLPHFSTRHVHLASAACSFIFSQCHAASGSTSRNMMVAGNDASQINRLLCLSQTQDQMR